MRKITNAIALISILFTCIMMMYAGNPKSMEWWMGVSEFMGLALIPYGIIIFFNNLWNGSSKKNIAMLATAVVVSAFAILLLVDAFFIHIDAQSGLIFIFLPMYQSATAILGGLISLGLYKKTKTTQHLAGADR